MQLVGIRTPLIKPRDDIVNVVLEAMHKQGLAIEDRDVLIFTSKVIATTQGRLVKLSAVKPSKKAEELAKRYDLEPGYVELVLQEADEILGAVSKALLTLKDDTVVANAGIDHKNAPDGHAVLWPENPSGTAEAIRRRILKKTDKHVGILIVDSRVTPLRMGTTGIAIGMAGIEPVKDFRSEEDLYGKPLHITRHAVADDLASAAHLLMGEACEQIPVVLARDAPVSFKEKIDSRSVIISTKECLFMNLLHRSSERG